MEANITQPQYAAGSLSEPHFDEEATLLSARPVVPLQEIKAAERSGKRRTLGLVLIAALMVGAFVLARIYWQRGQLPATVTVETALPEPGESAAAPAMTEAGGGISTAPATTTSASTAVSAKPSNVSAVPKGEPRDSAASRTRKPAVPAAPGTDSANSTETWRDEQAALEQKRAERQEARRLRREAQREAWGDVRSRRVQPNDDLLRIREIFEGPRRRPRLQRWQ